MDQIIIVPDRYKPSPWDINLDICGATIGGFGKYEIELEAGRLVQYFRYHDIGWCSFSFPELYKFWEHREWPMPSMLYGLMGAWQDEFTTYSGAALIVHLGDQLRVTKDFVDRCAKGQNAETKVG